MLILHTIALRSNLVEIPVFITRNPGLIILLTVSVFHTIGLILGSNYAQGTNKKICRFFWWLCDLRGPYSKSKLELESNL